MDVTNPDTLKRYAEHLRRLSETEREEVRERNAEPAAATPEEAPEWLILQSRWTLLALDAEDPEAALRAAIATSTDDVEDIKRVIEQFAAIADLWERREQVAAVIAEAEAATVVAMDMSPNLRRFLTGDDLTRIVARGQGGERSNRREAAEQLAEAAGLLEGIPEDELLGLRVDCSALAADLDEPPEVRKLAAVLALLAGSILDTGLADWDTLLDAGRTARDVRKMDT